MPYGPQVLIGPFSAQHITTNTTTTFGGLGSILHAIVINQVGTGETITVNDGVAGNTKAVISPTAGAVYTFDIIMTNTSSPGISIVTAGTTPGDYTALWTS